jgi:hypothetical protein
MGETQVAEGPLIRHVPGGFAEWRAKESGLPPARLRTSEGEWWGKLVGPTDTLDVDAGIGGGAVGGVGSDDVVGGFTGEEKQGLDDPSFETKLRDELNKELEPDPALNVSVQPYEWKTDYTPVDWDVNYNEVPKGYGWGVSTDSPILPYGQGSGIVGGVGGGPSSRGAVVPGGQGDRLTTRGSAGLQKPLVDFKPSPTEYVKGYDPDKTFVEKPGVIEDLKAIADDGLSLGERMVRAIAGPTAVDFKPRNPKESALYNKFKKGYEIFTAAIKEGGGVFGGTLYETGGGRTTPPSKTGEVPQAHFPNVLKTLRKVFAGEKDPIVMQDYGDLHWATIVATIGLANTYGPIVWAIPGLRTMAETIGASMNGMLMDKPNLEGNPVQDTMHILFWIAGQAGQKVYENSIGKIIEKLRDTPKSEKTRGTISEELDDLINIKDAFKGHKSFKRVKVSGRVEAAGAKHLQPLGYASPNLSQPRQPRQPREKKFPIGQPTATSATQGQPIIDDREEFKGQPIADKIQGEIVGEKPKGEIPTGRGKDKLRELEQEQEERERFKLGGETPIDQPKESPKTYKIQFGDGSVHEVDEETYLRETTPDESGVSNARPYEPKDERETIDTRDDKGTWFTDVPVDINGNPTSDPDRIHHIEPLVRRDLAEGQEQGTVQGYIDNLRDQWNNLQEWQQGGEKAEDFTWEQPEQPELRNYQGELVNQYGERINKEGKLLREEGGPKGEGSYYGGGGGYAETDYSEDELPSKFQSSGYQPTTYWHGFDMDGNEHHIQLEPEFKKVGMGNNATYYFRYTQPNINIDRENSDQMPSDMWQIWTPGE